MDDTARIDTRIASLHELSELFSAIEAMAASRVQAAQGALVSARRYADVIETAIADAACLLQGNVQGFWSSEPAPSALVLIGSEQGFTGAFNRLLSEHASKALAPGDHLICVGRRGAAIAAEHGLMIKHTLGMATRIEGVLTTARELAAALRDYTEIRIAFGTYAKDGRFDPVIRQVLPPNKRLFERGETANPPLHQMAPDLLLRRLIGELLLAELMLGLTESFASENIARLQIMQSADHNISDKLERLTAQSRQVRQDQITSELLEVVAGAEAISARHGGGGR